MEAAGFLGPRTPAGGGAPRGRLEVLPPRFSTNDFRGRLMSNRDLGRGLLLAAIALGFGCGSLRYPIGSFGHAGPGLFPLMVSGLLLVIAVLTIVRSRFVEPVPLDARLRNIGLVLLSLCAFALVSTFLDMTAGIVALVFIAAAAGGSYSVARNMKIAIGLIAIAFAFQALLGLNLPLL
jgi:hypothetical protein